MDKKIIKYTDFEDIKTPAVLKEYLAIRGLQEAGGILHLKKELLKAKTVKIIDTNQQRRMRNLLSGLNKKTFVQVEMAHDRPTLIEELDSQMAQIMESIASLKGKPLLKQEKVKKSGQIKNQKRRNHSKKRIRKFKLTDERGIRKFLLNGNLSLNNKSDSFSLKGSKAKNL